MDQLMTTAEVAERLAVSTRTVHRLVKARRISAVRLAGAWRFRRAAVELYLAQREIGANTAPQY